MTDTNTTPAKAPVADTAGSTLPPAPDYSIAPEDQHIADRLLDFDPVADVPSPTTTKGNPRIAIPDKLSVKMLPPEDQQLINAKLANVPANIRGDREDALVREHLKQKALELRIKAGPGEGANELQKERFLIASERHQANTEIMRLMEELSKVVRWEPSLDDDGNAIIDPETGQPKVNAINAVQGERRVGIERRIGELEHKIALLEGPEGDLRERRALHATVQTDKSRQAQIDEEREARDLGDKMARDERIRRRAEARAKAQRTAL